MVSNKNQKHPNPKKYWSQIIYEWKHFTLHSNIKTLLTSVADITDVVKGILNSKHFRKQVHLL
jgi:hypothetical protein